MWQWLLATDWIQPSLYFFCFVMGVKVAYEFLGGRRRLFENDERDAKQQREIDALGAQVQRMLKEKGVKKVTVKRRQK